MALSKRNSRAFRLYDTFRTRGLSGSRKPPPATELRALGPVPAGCRWIEDFPQPHYCGRPRFGDHGGQLRSFCEEHWRRAVLNADDLLRKAGAA